MPRSLSRFEEAVSESSARSLAIEILASGSDPRRDVVEAVSGMGLGAEEEKLAVAFLMPRVNRALEHLGSYRFLGGSSPGRVARTELEEAMSEYTIRSIAMESMVGEGSIEKVTWEVLSHYSLSDEERSRARNYLITRAKKAYRELSRWKEGKEG